jgi:hypothetical protein
LGNALTVDAQTDADFVSRCWIDSETALDVQAVVGGAARSVWNAGTVTDMESRWTDALVADADLVVAALFARAALVGGQASWLAGLRDGAAIGCLPRAAETIALEVTSAGAESEAGSGWTAFAIEWIDLKRGEIAVGQQRRLEAGTEAALSVADLLEATADFFLDAERLAAQGADQAGRARRAAFAIAALQFGAAALEAAEIAFFRRAADVLITLAGAGARRAADAAAGLQAIEVVIVEDGAAFTLGRAQAGRAAVAAAGLGSLVGAADLIEAAAVGAAIVGGRAATQTEAGAAGGRRWRRNGHAGAGGAGIRVLGNDRAGNRGAAKTEQSLEHGAARCASPYQSRQVIETFIVHRLPFPSVGSVVSSSACAPTSSASRSAKGRSLVCGRA